ncbi:MAG TPA: DUF6249 domain-containing protein [Opitutus sp.]|nr:DUF6249 domain-containing protein [Opitutus sp.]
MIDTSSPLPLALLNLAAFEFQPWMIAIIVPVAVLIFTAFFLGFGMYFQHRRRELWHATARIALEKGQPIPEPSPDAPYPAWQTPAGAKLDPRQRARGYFIGALINIGIGVGMAIAFYWFYPIVSYLSAIPICVGLALLVGGWIEHRAASQTQP